MTLALAASDARADVLTCPAGSTYKSVGRTIQSSAGNREYLGVQWCYSPSTHKVTAHAWRRGYYANGFYDFNGWNTSQSGGNGLSYYRITNDARFSIGSAVGETLSIDIQVNGWGSYAISDTRSTWASG